MLVFWNFFFFFTGATTLCGSWPPSWFRKSKYFRIWVPSPAPKLQLRGSNTTLPLAPTLWPVWYGFALPGAFAPTSIALRVTRARKPALHAEVSVLEDVILNTYIYFVPCVSLSVYVIKHFWYVISKILLRCCRYPAETFHPMSSKTLFELACILLEVADIYGTTTLISLITL